VQQKQGKVTKIHERVRHVAPQHVPGGLPVVWLEYRAASFGSNLRLLMSLHNGVLGCK
jgi:hypothetical protein